jgi:hypothetical protein
MRGGVSKAGRARRGEKAQRSSLIEAGLRGACWEGGATELG